MRFVKLLKFCQLLILLAWQCMIYSKTPQLRTYYCKKTLKCCFRMPETIMKCLQLLRGGRRHFCKTMFLKATIKKYMAFHVACTYQILTSRYLPCKYLHSLDIISYIQPRYSQNLINTDINMGLLLIRSTQMGS